MNNKFFFLLSLIFINCCLFFTSCEKADEYTSNPQTNFEALWKIIDQRYCFFEYKDIDWNEVHDRYKAQVADTMNQYQLFDLMGLMLAELKDGHVNLISSFDVARYWAWYENYPSNFNEDLHKHYLGINTDYKIAGGMKYRTLSEGQVGYIYYGSFSSGVSENNLDYILHYFKDCKGLIIDVRENGGGTLTYSDKIASRFVEEKIIAGYITHKTGKGHNDFSKPHKIELSPSERIKWKKPVVVITNRHSYSATNDFVNKMKILPQVTILGDRTGGGSGLPFNSELPNGWRIRFSASPMLDIHMEHTEYGIDPDRLVTLDNSDIQKNIDTLIEAAISTILEQSHR